MERVDDILHYWFGRIEDTMLPSKNRSQIWFAGTPEVDAEIRSQFEGDFHKALAGQYKHWEADPHGSLALIILYDQFSRNMFRDTAQAFEQDDMALQICLHGIETQLDHELSLIERAFFYMPLMHAEDLDMQTTSVQAFKMLADISFPEARPIFTSFLDYAIRHYEVIKAFGRFPQRNVALSRENTNEEATFLDNIDSPKW